TPFFLGTPDHTVPDRPAHPGQAVSFGADGLSLTGEARVVIADTTYANFDLSARTPTGGLPEIELGPVTIGRSCAWPLATGATFQLSRDGPQLALRVDDAQTSCQGPVGRPPIALRGPEDGTAVVRDLVVTRKP